MLITFSGLDGAGKSTLIEWLKGELEARRRPVVVFHMNDHIGLYAYLRAIRNCLAGRPLTVRASEIRTSSSTQASLGPALHRARDAVVWNRPLRRWIYLVDLAVFACYRAVVEKVRGRVLIMDRYFYDTLVDVSDGRGWGWVRLLKLVTPTPTVSIFLDIGPEESFRRKGEYSVEYLASRYRAYERVFDWVPSATRLANTDLERTRQDLWRVVAERGGALTP
jgi:thymidylate kinase